MPQRHLALLRGKEAVALALLIALRRLRRDIVAELVHARPQRVARRELLLVRRTRRRLPRP
jgi:hypothetical protein